MFEKLWIARTNEELQKIQQSYYNYDEVYVKFCVWENYKSDRDWLYKIYSQYNNYLDNNFVSWLKVKWSFNQRLWELYLLWYLKNIWYNLIEVKDNKSPDFKINFENTNIWIECVASTKWTWSNKLINIKDEHIVDLNKSNISRMLRLTTSLDEKRRKFNEYIKDNIVKKKDICIIALNWGESNWNLIDNWIASVLYWVWTKIYIKTWWELEWPFYKQRDNVDNVNWALVNTSIFNNKDYNNIDWLIYFASSIYNINDYSFEWKNNNCDPVDKLVFIKNPNSKKEIPEWFLNHINLEINFT